MHSPAYCIRSLRAAPSALSRPVPLPRASSSQHRQFASRPAASQSHPSLSSQKARPRHRPSPLCPSCHRKVPSTNRSLHVAAFANATIDAAETAIAQLHTVTHTPWYITIPLVALSVNLIFRLPLSIHARSLVQKRARLAPLLQAWTGVHTKEVLKERQQQQRQAGSADPIDTSLSSVQRNVMKRQLKTSSRIHAAFGVQQWKLYGNILALPPWLVVIEAIRRMCGAPVGLLGMIFRGSAGSDATSTAAESAAATVATAASASTDTVDVAAVALSDAASSAAAASGSMGTFSEPTLTVGGALWFPDLTVADPYHVLPFALSAMLVVNIMPGTDAGRRALFGLDSSSSPTGVVAQGLGARVLQRTLLVMSISVGFVTLHFPAAIHLYWLASAAVTYIITRSLHAFKPITDSRIRPRQRQNFPWIQPPRPPPTTKA